MDPAQSDSEAFPNIEKIGHGYNIYKGNPFGKVDHGYAQKIFAAVSLFAFLVLPL